MGQQTASARARRRYEPSRSLTTALEPAIVLAVLWIGFMKLLDLRVLARLAYHRNPELWMAGATWETGALGLSLPTWILATNLLLLVYLWLRFRSRLSGSIGRRMAVRAALVLAMVLLVVIHLRVVRSADDLPRELTAYTTQDGRVVMPWELPAL